MAVSAGPDSSSLRRRVKQTGGVGASDGDVDENIIFKEGKDLDREAVVRERSGRAFGDVEEEDMEDRLRTVQVFLGCVAVRFASAIFVQTYFNPDEYWQSLEVAHRLVFGYGYLTWEWRAGVRGFFHPLIFAAVYKVLLLLGADSPLALELFPRLLQALFAAAADLYTYKLSAKLFGKSAAKWALFCQLINWFNFFCMIRTFSNCLETSLTMMALFYWPWRGASGKLMVGDSRRHSRNRQSPQTSCCGKDKQNIDEDEDDDAQSTWRQDGSLPGNRAVSLVLAGLACVTRPTNAVIWLFLGSVELKRAADRVRYLFLEVIPIGMLSFGFMMSIDRWMYGEWVIVPLNFVRFNVLASGADFYGTHPWHWYISQGFPAIVGTLLPFTLAGMWWSPQPLLGILIVEVLACYSLLGHKEFRFVLPVLPVAMMLAGYALSLLTKQRMVLTHSKEEDGSGAGGRPPPPPPPPASPHRHPLTAFRKWPWLARLSSIVIIVSNVAATLYLSLVHQRGSMDAIRFIAKETAEGKVRSVFFLMPCHATPFYSHVHRPIPMRILDCTPSSETGHVHEERRFFDSPMSYLTQMYDLPNTTAASSPSTFCLAANREYLQSIGNLGTAESDCFVKCSPDCLPSHLVMFDGLHHQIRQFLDGHGYKLASTFFHSHVPVDRELQSQLLIFAKS